MKLTTFLVVIILSLLFSTAHADEGLLQADLGDCRLENGQDIKHCVVAYRVLGELKPDRSNIIVFPTWYGGSTSDLVKYGYIGPGKMADTDEYYVIAIEAFGNGISSSPSNSTSQAGKAFPQYSVRDMVHAQYRLLIEKLGINHVFAVMGVSMGGFQVYEWMTTYPGFMDYAVPVEGTPWPTAYDLMLWTAWLDAADTDAGDAESKRRAAMLLAALDGLTLWTPRYFNAMVEAQGFEEYMEGFSASLRGQYLLNRRSQTVAVLNHDISRPFEDFESRAGHIIKAKTLVVVFKSDHMVNPGPSQELAKWIGAETLVLESDCGHMSPNQECVQAEVSAAIHTFLMGGEKP